MYKSVIKIKSNTPNEILEKLVVIADKAFNNRAGVVKNVSDNPYKLIYEGKENKFGCLELGMLTLEKKKDFLYFIEAWNWIDENDPDESCDILAEMMNSVK